MANTEKGSDFIIVCI